MRKLRITKPYSLEEYADLKMNSEAKTKRYKNVLMRLSVINLTILLTSLFVIFGVYIDVFHATDKRAAFEFFFITCLMLVCVEAILILLRHILLPDLHSRDAITDLLNELSETPNDAAARFILMINQQEREITTTEAYWLKRYIRQRAISAHIRSQTKSPTHQSLVNAAKQITKEE